MPGVTKWLSEYLVSASVNFVNGEVPVTSSHGNRHMARPIGPPFGGDGHKPGQIRAELDCGRG